MHLLAALLAIASAIVPTRTWYPPSEPLTLNIKAEGDSTLVLTDFNGAKFDPKTPAEVSGEKTVNLKEMFAEVSKPGTYVLYVLPKGKELPQFSGTPLVIEVRSDSHRGGPADAMVIK